MNTEQKLKVKYLPTSEFYSQVIDSLQDYSIFTIDNDSHINSWNSGATRIFQYDAEEIIGQNFEIIFSDIDIRNGIPQKEIETASREGKALDNRWHIRKDGTKFYAYGLVFPLTGIDGEKLGYVKILKDLTEQKKSQDAANKYLKELEELNTHKENVLSILSHDLRSPLAAIISTIKYLETEFDNISREEAKDLISLIHKSSKDEINMLDYLVEWARIKYASEAFTPTKIELFKNVAEVFSRLEEVAAIKGILLYNNIEEDKIVFADKKMLTSILQNLISNALQYTAKRGSVTISASDHKNKITIEIKDTGKGMSGEVVEKLFTPQLNTLLKERENKKGAGIGLLLVKGLLDKNAGEIWAESSEGIGSTFYFTLPNEKHSVKPDNTDKIELIN